MTPFAAGDRVTSSLFEGVAVVVRHAQDRVLVRREDACHDALLETDLVADAAQDRRAA